MAERIIGSHVEGDVETPSKRFELLLRSDRRPRDWLAATDVAAIASRADRLGLALFSLSSSALCCTRCRVWHPAETQTPL